MANNMRREVADIMRRLSRDHGCEISRTGGNHWRIKGPNGVSISTSQTPSDQFAIRRIRADLKRHLDIVL